MISVDKATNAFLDSRGLRWTSSQFVTGTMPKAKKTSTKNNTPPPFSPKWIRKQAPRVPGETMRGFMLKALAARAAEQLANLKDKANTNKNKDKNSALIPPDKESLSLR